MKIYILLNNVGEIIGTYKPTPDKSGLSGMISPVGAGHSVREVEVPDELTTPESITKLHEMYRVEVTGNIAKIIEKTPVKK